MGGRFCALFYCIVAAAACAFNIIIAGASEDSFPFQNRNHRNAILPQPTAAQLAYQDHEIMALIHFNMATFIGNGDPGCGPDNWIDNSSLPSTFSPDSLDTDGWADTMDALGVKSAVLTAKHGCGFAIWPTTATLPDGSPYKYHASVNVIRSFVDSMKKRGIGHGFYYSLTNNFYLNVIGMKAGHYAPPIQGQVNVSQDEFQAIALHQLTELWTQYGNLTEIWFDGGYNTQMQSKLMGLLQTHQPNAVGYNGGGIVASPARWAGTEGDMTTKNYPHGVWSTYCCNKTKVNPNPNCVVAHTGACVLNDPASPYGGAGCPATGLAEDKACDTFMPAGVDYTLQASDVWFWMPPPQQLRPLSELIFQYHQSVGRNTVLELDFAIDRSGRIDPSHDALYRKFGAWIRECYGTPVASKANGIFSRQMWATDIDTRGKSIDRIVLMENQTQGQRVTKYRVDLITENAVQPLSNGTSIGRKRIDLFTASVKGIVRLTVESTAMNLPPLMRSVQVFAPCTSGEAMRQEK